MTDVIEQSLKPVILHTAPAVEMNDNQFFDFCRLNPDWRIERNAEGDLIIMAPAGGSTGSGNAKLIQIFGAWADLDGSGRVFDSSTGFKLPNGATRSPDVAWVRHDRLDRLTDQEWQGFLPLCPDFVLELRSPSDSLSLMKEKMEEYRAEGAALGWLIDPLRKEVHLYRPGEEVQVLADPSQVSAHPVLNGFALEMQKVWSAIQRRR